MKVSRVLCPIVLIVFCFNIAIKSSAQDSIYKVNLNQGIEYVNVLSKKFDKYEGELDQMTDKTLTHLIDQEKKMCKKISKIDSAVSKKLFQFSIDSLTNVRARLRSKLPLFSGLPNVQYDAYLDTLKQALPFIKSRVVLNEQLLFIKDSKKSVLELVESYQSKTAEIEKLRSYINQRYADMQGQVKQFSILKKSLAKYSLRANSLKERAQEIKGYIDNPSRIEQKMLASIRNLPDFQKAMESGSALSKLFASPASIMDKLIQGPSQIVNGLPSRLATISFMSTNVPTPVELKSMLSPEHLLNDLNPRASSLLERVNNKGKMGSKELPDYEPNTQRTKSISKRLEFGTDLQVNSAAHRFPAMINVGLKMGFKLNDKSVAGIGGTYMLGLGTDWKHIQFTNQAAGARTFVKWKVKKTLSIQGGNEWNYMLQFKNFEELKRSNQWQQSTLFGLSKSYSVGKKIKGNFDILYDLRYRRHIPATQPIVFRFGYSK